MEETANRQTADEQTTTAQKEGGVELSVATVIGIAVLGVGLVITVGLVSGFALRPGNCRKVERPATQPPQPGGTTTQQPGGGTTSAPSNFRLPKSVVPVQQNLLLRFDFDPYTQEPKGTRLTYTGETTIQVNVVEPTSQIILHMQQNVVPTDSNIVITNLATNQLVQVQSSGYAENERFIIRLGANLAANGNYTILLKFRAQTTDLGVYYHGYTEGVSQRSLVASRLAPIEARTAFPCFDEPSFKAKFVITIEHPAQSNAVSNFPQDSRTQFQDGSGKTKIRTIFQPTYPMSSYMVAWAIVADEFASKSLPDVPGQATKVTVWGRKSEINNNYADFALDTIPKLINAMVSYTGVRDALPPKIDFIALPDFPQLTAPSWGLNGFREDFLLYNPKYDSDLVQSGIAEALAKDIAANWFGNYITCSFWDDLWLNQGFSIYFGFKILGVVFPQLDVENKYINVETVPTMWRDAYQRIQPLKYTFTSSVDIINEALSDVRGKSASILRMIESSVSPDAFREDVINYLTNHPFGVTTSNYFYSIFRSPNPAAISMKAWIEPWIIQKNFPIVTVEPRVQGANTIVDFTQARFSLSRGNFDPNDPNRNYLWAIYLRCKAGGTANSPTGGQVVPFDYLLTTKSGSAQLNGQFNWVKCNNDFKGFYMTNYTDSQFQTFEQVILASRDTFSIGDRSNLIHVSFELAFVGHKSYAIPSYLTVYLDSLEDKVVPWQTFFYHVDKLALLLEHRASFKNLRGFATQIMKNAIARLGLDIWSNSASHDEELLKISLANTLCLLTDAEALNKTTELFKRIPPLYFESPSDHDNPISPNLRGIVYKYHLENSNDFNDWYKVYDFYGLANDLREREYAVVSLANTRLNWLFDFILRESINPESRLDKQAAYLLLPAMARNPTGRYFAWYFIREYWGEMVLRGFNEITLRSVLKIMTSSFETVLLLEEVETFFQGVLQEPNSIVKRQIEETIIINSYWTSFLEKDFEQFFFDLSRQLDL